MAGEEGRGIGLVVRNGDWYAEAGAYPYVDIVKRGSKKCSGGIGWEGGGRSCGREKVN